MQAVRKMVTILPACLKRLECVMVRWAGTKLTIAFIAESAELYEMLCKAPQSFWLRITEINSPNGKQWTVDHRYSERSVTVEFESPNKVRIGFFVEEKNENVDFFEVKGLFLK